MKDLEKEEMELLKNRRSEHHDKCTVADHDVCICDQIRDYEKVNMKDFPDDMLSHAVDGKKVQESIEKDYGGAFTPDPNDPHEKERLLFAKKREELGKPPKQERGQTAREQRSQLLLGCLVESIISSIRIVEASEGKQLFNFEVPLSDGRRLAVSLQAGK